MLKLLTEGLEVGVLAEEPILLPQINANQRR
jgi:hypothetical protein